MQLEMRIKFVQMVGHTSGILDVEPSDTIRALKGKIQDKTGLPPEQCDLVWVGKMLEDDRCVADYGMAAITDSNLDELPLRVILRVRGTPAPVDVPVVATAAPMENAEDVFRLATPADRPRVCATIGAAFVTAASPEMSYFFGDRFAELVPVFAGEFWPIANRSYPTHVHTGVIGHPKSRSWEW